MPSDSLCRAARLAETHDGLSGGGYVVKNPQSTGCKTCFSGGMVLNVRSAQPASPQPASPPDLPRDTSDVATGVHLTWRLGDGRARAQEWDIEDEQFYKNEGRAIGARNLWASIPNLLMGFAVWLMW